MLLGLRSSCPCGVLVLLGVVSNGGSTTPSSTNPVRSSSSRVVSHGALASVADDDGITDLRACISGFPIPDERAQCLCDDEGNWSAFGMRRFVGKPMQQRSMSVPRFLASCINRSKATV